jgi:hypothetical protein
MRFLLVATAAFVLFAGLSTATMAGVSTTIVEDVPGRLTVDVEFSSTGGRELGTVELPGTPPLRFERIFVAVPGQGSIRVRRVDGAFVDRLDNIPAPREDWTHGQVESALSIANGFFPPQPVRASERFAYRHSHIIAVDCFASQVDYAAGVHRVWSNYQIVVEYPSGAVTTQADPLVASLVANESIPATPLRHTAGSLPVPDPQFSKSTNWVKVRTASAGAYTITGSDLIAIGVSLGSIADPASFRLFTLGAMEEARDLTAGTGTYVPGTWMNECDILVDYGDDASFDPGDRIVFYAVGSRGFSDLYEPGQDRTAFHDHLYAKDNLYYLTWDSGFSGEAARMDSVVAAPTADPDMATFEERLYFEENFVDDFTFGGDGWLWLDVTESTGQESFPFLPGFHVQDLDPTQLQTFRTVAFAKVRSNNANHHARYLINGNIVADKVWNTGGTDDFDQGKPVEASGFFLNEGNNLFTLVVPRDLHTKDFMYFAWYSVFYHRTLKAFNDALFFSSPDTTGSVNYAVSGFSPTGTLYAFDVSDHYHPVRLTGGAESTSGTRTLRLAGNVGSARRAYYWVGTEATLRRPSSMTRYFPRDLRNKTSSPHMLIITDASFRSSAELLRSHRLQNLPMVQSPVIEVVTTTEIFDNFSGGMQDPMAIRNYIKFLYDNFGAGGPALTYVLLLGDANADFKNNRNQQPNYVTSNLNLRPYLLDAYTTDEYFALLDPADVPGKGLMDVALGRLPAGSPSEADFLVRKVLDYERSAEFGPWRDRVILVADDEISSLSTSQAQFVILSDSLAHRHLPGYIDAVKLYLTEYPAIQRIKPAARLQFLREWNEGALAINYVGHGSSVQMADEQVFLSADVGNLTNGLKLPLFVAVSCTIGDFTAGSKSLSERLLLREGGGVIATMTASELTYIQPNEQIDINLFRTIFSDPPSEPLPLGVGVQQAKFQSISATFPLGNRLIEENNQKYNLLGDPAMLLRVPRRSLEFTATDIDTFTTGRRETVRGRVLNQSGQTDTGFSGTVRLLVRETDDESGYVRESDGFAIWYRYPGGKVYEGSADVTAGMFEFSFKVPRFAETGDKGLVLAYAEDGVIDGVAKDYTVVLRAPTVNEPDATQPVDGAPRIDLGFKGGLKIVKPGAVLEGRINDADGVNILGTTPEGKLALLFDDTALPVDVTEFFEFDHGGIDTAGVVTFPLQVLSVGDHRAILKVSDTFGQTSLDTVYFSVTDPLDYAAEVVMNYPNPFETDTHFLISLTDPARVKLEIFTVTGKRVRTLEETKDAGEQWITWDGYDRFGGSVANGTYLYVARVAFTGLKRPPVVIRGKIVKID